MVIIWSENLDEIDLMHCDHLQKLELYCPALLPSRTRLPPLADLPGAGQQPWPPIAGMIREMGKLEATRAGARKELMRASFTGRGIDLQIPELTLLLDTAEPRDDEEGEEKKSEPSVVAASTPRGH